MPDSKSGSEDSGSESETDSLPETKRTSGWGAETQKKSIGQSNAESGDESDGGDSKKQEKVKPGRRRSRFRYGIFYSLFFFSSIKHTHTHHITVKIQIDIRKMMKVVKKNRSC